jgi:hypothetical protein
MACYVSPDSDESIERCIRAMLDRASGSMVIYNREGASKPILESWSEIGKRLAEIYNQYVK